MRDRTAKTGQPELEKDAENLKRRALRSGSWDGRLFGCIHALRVPEQMSNKSEIHVPMVVKERPGHLTWISTIWMTWNRSSIGLDLNATFAIGSKAEMPTQGNADVRRDAAA